MDISNLIYVCTLLKTGVYSFIYRGPFWSFVDNKLLTKLQNLPPFSGLARSSSFLAGVGAVVPAHVRAGARYYSPKKY